jgi:hypothetical protein
MGTTEIRTKMKKKKTITNNKAGATDKKGNILVSVKEALADQIGVESTDILDEDSFSEDLHMRATDLADFMSTLGNMGFDTSKIDFAEIETFKELEEHLSSQELI